MIGPQTESSVTVIIPAFNAASTLADAVGSALAQDCQCVTSVIIVDDGSSDDTMRIAASLADANPDFLKLVSHTGNRGPSAARNTGARLAETPWIAFLDADDMWRADKLSTQLGAMAASGCQPDVSTTDVLVLPMDARHPYLHRNNARRSRQGVIRQLAESDINRLTPTILIHRRLFDSIGGFDESLPRMEDHEFLIRAVRAGVFLHVPLPLTVNRVFAQSTRTRDLQSLQTHFERFVDTVAAQDRSLVGCGEVLSARVALGNLIANLRRKRLWSALMAFRRLLDLGLAASYKVVAYAVRRKLLKLFARRARGRP